MAEAEEARRDWTRSTACDKAQQDALLPRVKAGDIVLIGATTENHRSR